ncbi:MAG: metalloregulator ArsR/SmtB family transcription factor [Proteobacteria bacterium]|jgi:ArsR family transcriptional regulator, arsenate/arsenite/antimonite-responsive transcriptional repressor|nr:metalloregulator ArsR/SmtB family transcription factor [Pseudomonadota bacterium]
MQIEPANFYKQLADETRLRSLVLMMAEGELCVCELTYALGVSQPKISRHLAQLREARLVQDRRAGQWIYYRVNPELPDWARTVLDTTMIGLRNGKPFGRDRDALERMPNRPGAACCV